MWLVSSEVRHNKSLEASGGSGAAKSKGQSAKRKEIAPPRQLRRWMSSSQMKRLLLNLTLLLPGLVMFAAACNHRQTEMEPVGPDVKASFVVYLQAGVTQEQINDFSKRVLSRPRADGRGDYLPEGVRNSCAYRQSTVMKRLRSPFFRVRLLNNGKL